MKNIDNLLLEVCIENKLVTEIRMKMKLKFCSYRISVQVESTIHSGNC